MSSKPPRLVLKSHYNRQDLLKKKSLFAVSMLKIRSKDAPTNPRGIPVAPFVDKVEDYVSSRVEIDGTMKNFQEMISYGFSLFPDLFSFLQACQLTGHIQIRKYQFMEANVQRRSVTLKEKIPEIQKTLDAVQFLKTRKVSSSLVCIGVRVRATPPKELSNRPV